MLKDLLTELRLRGHSDATIKSYLKFNREFLDYVKKDPSDVDVQDIKYYLGFLVSDKKLAARSINLARAALFFYYNEVLEQNFNKIKTPKIHSSLPVVLSKTELVKLIECAGSRK